MAKWQKALGWTAVAIGALILVVVVGGLLLLRSSGFRHYLLTKIDQKASAATGAQIHIQNFDLHVRTLTTDIYGLTIHGTEAAGEKPLLQVQHATVGIRILSVLRGKFNLTELLIDHPVANLVVNKEGRSNLPQPPPSNSKSSTNVFQLAVGHVLLSNGEIYLKDQKVPVDANLFGLRTEIRFSQLEQKYSGSLGYDSGTIYYTNLKPLPHALHASFEATPSELRLKPLLLKVGGSHVLLDATVRDYSNTPLLNGRYDVLLHTQDFAGLSTERTDGDVVLTGTMNYRAVANEPALRNAQLHGRIDSNGLTITDPQAVVTIRKIAGNYELANGTFQAEGLAFDLLNGTLKADGRIKHLDSTTDSRFHVAIAGISLQAVKSSLRAYSRQSVPVTGTVSAQADAAWTGSVKNLRASSGIQMRGALVSSPQAKFPLSANIRVNYDGPRNLISVPAGTIQLPSTTITAQGQIGGGSSLASQSNLAIKAVSSNLHDLMRLVAGFSSSSGQPSTLASVQGALTLNDTVQGTLQNPQVHAQVSATRLQVNQGQFNSLQFALNASPSSVTLQNGSLSVAPHGQLQFSGSTRLKHWAYDPDGPIQVSLQIQQIPLAMLDQLATKSYPITGTLNGGLQLQGSAMNPAGQGKLQITKAKVEDEPLQNVILQFNAANGTIRSQLSVGSTNASLNFTPKTKAYQVNLTVPSQQLEKLHALQRKNIPVKGTIAITANGAGTIEDPKLNAQVQLSQFQMRETSFSQVNLSLNVANHAANLALASSGGPADLRGHANVHLTPGYFTAASLDTSKFPLAPILALYVPSRPSGLDGESELHASIRGPLADKTKIEAHLTIPTLRASYQSLQLANTAPIRVDYANSVVILQPSGFTGTGTSLQFQGRVPLQGDAAMSAMARGTIDLRLAQMVNPDLRTGGKILLDMNARGGAKHPSIGGTVQVQNASFASQTVPVGISNLNAMMQLTDTALQVTNAQGEMGGGQINFGGSVIYRPQLQANLSLKAKGVRLRYPEGVRTVFDSDLMLTGDSQASTVQGRVLIDSVSFTPDFNPSDFMAQFTGSSAPPTGQSFADNLKLQVAIQSSSQLNAGTAQLGFEGSANLKLIGTASNPVVIGRTDITSGDIFFEKRQYHLSRGIINFVDPNQTQPVLNMQITTVIDQYNLTIDLRGPMNKLQISYLSDPPLPPVDIIKLIAFGTAPGAPESFGASTVLAQGLGEVESAVGSGVSKLTGIAGLQIDPMIGGNNSNPSARIGFQKRVTKNFTFTFSSDVTQPQSEIFQGEYQLNKRWSVSAVRDTSGGVAVDGRYHTNF